MMINSYLLGNATFNQPILKPNLITGEGRMRCRGSNKLPDLKKHKHRKMAKKSKRVNRR